MPPISKLPSRAASHSRASIVGAGADGLCGRTSVRQIPSLRRRCGCVPRRGPQTRFSRCSTRTCWRSYQLAHLERRSTSPVRGGGIFVPCPVVFRFEGVRAEGALEYALFVIGRLTGVSRQISPSAASIFFPGQAGAETTIRSVRRPSRVGT